MGKEYIQGGQGTLRPYLYVGMDMIDFVQDVFAAVIVGKIERPGGCHVEAKVGDTRFVMEADDKFLETEETTRASLYLFVEDVDVTYAKAISSGATSIAGPEDQPYGDRRCGIRDGAGNIWWIATHLGGA